MVAEAANGREAMDIVRQDIADVMLLDISMPDQSGVDTLVAIKARSTRLAVLILSGFPEAHYATALLRQGAAGYLGKDCDPDEIVKAIRTVALGRRYITAGVAEQLAASLGGDANQPVHEQLSERELQVFLRLAKGEDHRPHGAEHVAEREDGVHLPHPGDGEKMGLASNSDLTYYALKNGLIQ